MKWTSEPPTQDGWYFVRTIWLKTGKPDREISVEYVNVRRFREREMWREQAVKRGQLTVFRKEQWGGPIPEPEDA